MFSAMRLRRPRRGTRVSPAAADLGALACRANEADPEAAARTSSGVIRPFSPVPATEARSTPRSRAIFRVAGVASALVDVETGAGAGTAVGTDGDGGGA